MFVLGTRFVRYENYFNIIILLLYRLVETLRAHLWHPSKKRTTCVQLGIIKIVEHLVRSQSRYGRITLLHHPEIENFKLKYTLYCYANDQ